MMVRNGTGKNNKYKSFKLITVTKTTTTVKIGILQHICSMQCNTQSR